MEFLRRCAARLDEGESAETVLRDMRTRYTTSRSLNVHTCRVRRMCAPTPAYTAACARLLEEAESEEMRTRIEKAIEGAATPDAVVRDRLATLPHRLPENVYALRVTRAEVRECKRLTTRGAMQKNCTRRCVNGRALLADARFLVAHPEEAPSGVAGVLDLALALMLVTGRRTCETLNMRSTLEEEDTHAARFGGQAKRRGGPGEAYTISLLAPFADVARALDELRRRQGHRDDVSNRATSRRYQSALRQRLLRKSGAWTAVGCVHDLRGIYACMALRLFRWPSEYSEAFLAMSLLGHRGLHESLVYTPFYLGEDFADEPLLGSGRFTPSFDPEETSDS